MARYAPSSVQRQTRLTDTMLRCPMVRSSPFDRTLSSPIRSRRLRVGWTRLGWRIWMMRRRYHQLVIKSAKSSEQPGQEEQSNRKSSKGGAVGEREGDAMPMRYARRARGPWRGAYGQARGVRGAVAGAPVARARETGGARRARADGTGAADRTLGRSNTTWSQLCRYFRLAFPYT